jgi:hypothetical protein
MIFFPKISVNKTTKKIQQDKNLEENIEDEFEDKKVKCAKVKPY